ncbi:hypothetical protein [Pseudomonas sp. KNUC1026]|uniref:hypothetical protein n=1 Tax=Pseudomonas sp. KNUC1026 TaxID=2893890 RepID=UPI001F336A0C|nr:hypothetical protein [Pseudomonas sp. KNUC1026]UFH48117.1 hypothetical protein LN139_12945 [Pseudomonas sp. KNUC1026]
MVRLAGIPEGPTLNASTDGLILHLPVSNELLGMHNQYNTSIIGSHAGNPTLEAVSQEMQARWQQARDFYHSRPSQEADPEAFSQYAARLNRLTGPGVFNDVIDQRLPALYQLRQYFNLIAMLPLNVRGVLDIDKISEAMAQHMTFMFFTEPGALHSWTHT